MTPAGPAPAAPGFPTARAGFLDRIQTAGRAREVDRLRTALVPLVAPRILDVGGRNGAFTSRFAPPGSRVVVLEPDGRGVRSGRTRHPEFRFVEGRGEALPFPARAFDAVTAVRSTHHMTSPERFLEEALRVLDEGGRLIIEELSHTSRTAAVFTALGHVRHSGAMDLRGPDAWRGALETAGYVGVSVSAFPPWYLLCGRKPAPRAAGPLPVRSGPTG